MAATPKSIQVEYNPESFNKLMQPVLDEINSLRRRVADLEKALAQTQAQLLRMADDGR